MHFKCNDVITSDNVAYMKKAFSDILSILSLLCVHIPCNSHIMNFVEPVFKRDSKK